MQEISFSFETHLLNPSEEEMFRTVLRLAGWYPGRKVDISDAEEYYNKHNCYINDAARSFMEEFYGIKSLWLFKFKEENGRYKSGGLYFCFDTGNQCNAADRPYLPVGVREKATPLGLFGFHIPGILWVDEYGVFYISYEYEYEDDGSRNFHRYDRLSDFLKEEIKFPSEEVWVSFVVKDSEG